MGAGGSFVPGIGFEASTGIAINPGFFGQEVNAGQFGSIGGGVGLNIGVDAFSGVIFGDFNQIAGDTGNINVGVGPVSISLFFSETSGFSGFTVGPGFFAPLPFGVSATASATGAASIDDFKEMFGGFRDAISSLNPSGDQCKP